MCKNPKLKKNYDSVELFCRDRNCKKNIKRAYFEVKAHLDENKAELNETVFFN
jgi:hypothetical protein